MKDKDYIVNFNSIKKSILTLTSSALGSNIATSVVSLGTAATLTSVGLSPFVAIPALLGAYILYTNAKDQLEKNEKQQEYSNLLKKVREEFSPQLETIRSTEVTLLEKELNNSLKAEDIKDLQKFIISILEDQSLTLADIAENLSFNLKEITELGKSSEAIQSSIKELQKISTQEHNEIKDEIRASQEAILAELRNAQKLKSQDIDIMQAIFNTGTMVIPISTNIDGIFDSSIQIIWNEIVEGNYNKALQNLDKLSTHIKYKDSISVKVWVWALKAKIYYAMGKIQDANNAVCESQKFLDNDENIHSILQVVYARYYIQNNDNSKALAILEKIANTDYEACALWIAIVGKTALKLESILSEEQLNNYVVAESLSQKFFDDDNYPKALKYAQLSFDNAQKSGAFPCYSSLATALLINKTQSKFNTIGFTRNFIDKSTWPEFHKIVELYKQALAHYKQIGNSIVQSIIHHSLASVHFMCRDVAETNYHITELFALPKIAKSIIEGSIAIWVSLGYHKEALNALAKREKNLVPSLRFLYARLLLWNDNTEDAYNILHSLGTDNEVDTDIRFEALLYLGYSYLKNNDNEAFNKLQENLKCDIENNNSILKLLEALNLQATDHPKAIELISEVIPNLPDCILRNGNFLDVMMPVLKHLQMRKVILDILEPLVPTDEITDTGREYFINAFDDNDVKRLQAFCKQLRNNGCYNFDILCNELTFICSRSFQEAAILAQDILDCKLKPLLRQQINVCHDMIRAKLGTLKDADVSIDDYPSLNDINVSKPAFPWCNIPLLLKEDGYIDEAIDYGYELLMRFPKEKHLKGIYLATILGSNSTIPNKNFDVVSINSAVTYENSAQGAKHTIIIEDSDFSSEDRNEYKSTSSLGKLLLGHKLNDCIELSFGNEVTITAIQNKYSYRFHEVMERESQLPDSGMVMFHTPIDSEGKPDLSNLFTFVNNQQEEHKQNISIARQFFLEKMPSLYIFSHFSCLDLKKTLRYFAIQSDLFIITAQGDTNEREYSLNLLRNKNKKILLSPMTIEVLLLLEASSDICVIDILKASGLNFCICEYIPENYREELQFPFSNETLYASENTLAINSDNFEEKRYKALLSMMEFFKEIEIIPGELNETDFEKTEKATKWIWGRALYQTLLIASKRDDVILWEDDFNGIFFCQKLYEEIKVKGRIFTQAIFLSFFENGGITPQQKVQVNIFLLTINEVFTSFDAQTIVEILSKPEKYSPLENRLFSYLKSQALHQPTLEFISKIAAMTFATDYIDKELTKQALKLWFDELKVNYKQLAKRALAQGMRDAYKKSKSKSKAILAFVANNYVDLLDLSDIREFRRLSRNIKKSKKSKKNKRKR